jgi:hypothetical protein
VLPPPSPARTDFTLITECTPQTSGCNSVYSVGLPIHVQLGIIVYLEYHSVCPIVGIRSPKPFPRKRVCLPRKRVCLPPWTQRGATLSCGCTVMGLNSDDWTVRLALCTLCDNPYYLRGFVGSKKKTTVGLLVFNPLW